MLAEVEGGEEARGEAFNVFSLEFGDGGEHVVGPLFDEGLGYVLVTVCAFVERRQRLTMKDPCPSGPYGPQNEKVLGNVGMPTLR